MSELNQLRLEKCFPIESNPDHDNIHQLGYYKAPFFNVLYTDNVVRSETHREDTGEEVEIATFYSKQDALDYKEILLKML